MMGVVIGPGPLYYPVDYKLSNQVTLSFAWQITVISLRNPP